MLSRVRGWLDYKLYRVKNFILGGVRYFKPAGKGFGENLISIFYFCHSYAKIFSKIFAIFCKFCDFCNFVKVITATVFRSLGGKMVAVKDLIF